MNPIHVENHPLSTNWLGERAGERGRLGGWECKNGTAMLNTQRGFSLAWILAAVAALAALAVMGSTVYSTVIGGNQRTSLITTAGQILTQAAYTLNTEVAYNIQGIPVAPPILVASPAPFGGGQVPTTSAAPKRDPWGTALGYCTNAASAQGDPVFAIISAGPDKIFNTPCSQALLGNVSGDDGLRARNVANVKQGVGGTVYFGDPVPTAEDLGNLTLVKVGEMRVVRADASVWINVTGTPGLTGWIRATAYGSGGVAVIGNATAGDNCALFGEGTLARDIQSGDLLVCEEASRVGLEDIDCATNTGKLTIDSIRRLYVCG